jgi:hypothetical protein
LSFDIEGHFYKAYAMVSSGSTHPRGLLQCLSRVRNLENIEVHILAKNMILHDRVSFFTYREIEKNIETIFEISKYDDVLFEDEHLTIQKDVNYKTNYIFNQVEQYNSNSYCFLSYLKLLCKEKGYDFYYDNEKGEKVFKNKKNAKINSIMSSACPSQEEYYEIKKRIECSKATEEDKIKFKKYILLVSDLSYDMNSIRLIEKEFKERNNDVINKETNKEEYEEKYKNIIECEKQIKHVNQAKNFCCLLNVKNIDKNLMFKDINNNLESTKYIKIIQDIHQFLNIFKVVNICEMFELKDFKETIEKNKNKLNLFTDKIYKKMKIKKENSTKEIIAHLNIVLNKFGLNIFLKQKSIKRNNKVEKENKYIIKTIDDIKNIIEKYKGRINLDKIFFDDNDDIFDVFDIKK